MELFFAFRGIQLTLDISNKNIRSKKILPKKTDLTRKTSERWEKFEITRENRPR